MRKPRKPILKVLSTDAIGRIARQAANTPANRLKSTYVSTVGGLLPTRKSPDEVPGTLFHDVQEAQVYGDGKTFVDLVPRRRMKQIQREYLIEKNDPNFDLQDFVSRHFYRYAVHDEHPYQTPPDATMREHIRDLWPVLERKNRRARGSLVALPNAYVVPGGRFSEQFYWDSYFIMLGLAADGKWSMIEGMMKNYTFMIRKYGFIPTANRTYFLSRSQPPLFARMVKLLVRHKGKRALIEYLPYLILEYRFWMKGRKQLDKSENKAYARVAEMPNGVFLNRYYDHKMTPRPDTYVQDTDRAGESPDRDSEKLYLHLRAAAESGWDFSSRWFQDPQDIRTVHTADIIPVDLNCLLYDLEMTIADAYQYMLQPILAKRFHLAAERRARSIHEYCWNEAKQFYVDYNFHHHEQKDVLSLAAIFPLWSRIATTQQANAVAKRLEADFLKKGGLVTTLNATGQQWDSPNGWAPLHYIAIEGLRNYGYYELANKIKRAWISTNQIVFDQSRKLVEKYDVVNPSAGGGGEYTLQDGFGWTNGVLAVLLDEQ